MTSRHLYLLICIFRNYSINTVALQPQFYYLKLVYNGVSLAGQEAIIAFSKPAFINWLNKEMIAPGGILIV